MHGRGAQFLGCLIFFALIGCGSRYDGAAPADDLTPVRTLEAGAAFNAPQTGIVEGRVVWQGALPNVPDFAVMHGSDVLPPDGRRVTHELNPFCPQVDGASMGVNDAVVFLRGIDPARAAPWPHGTPRVEQINRQLRVVQAGRSGLVGFLKSGEAFEGVNCDREYHSLRGRGAAFFNLPFVEPGRPSAKQLEKTGVVVLSSGTGFFWMQAHLFVTDHPYYARTDRTGRFRLAQVPTGRYDAVCWLPSWVIARQDREPESGMVNRLIFAPPMEQASPIDVRAGAISPLSFTLKAETPANGK